MGLYTTSSIVRDRIQLTTLSVNHGGIAILADADIALSPIHIADQPTTFEIVCARACVGCFAAIVVLLYQPCSQPLPQQQTFIDELTPVSERVKFDVAIYASYRIAIFCVISYCIVSFSITAVSCQH